MRRELDPGIRAELIQQIRSEVTPGIVEDLKPQIEAAITTQYRPMVLHELVKGAIAIMRDRMVPVALEGAVMALQQAVEAELAQAQEGDGS